MKPPISRLQEPGDALVKLARQLHSAKRQSISPPSLEGSCGNYHMWNWCPGNLMYQPLEMIWPRSGWPVWSLQDITFSFRNFRANSPNRWTMTSQVQPEIAYSSWDSRKVHFSLSFCFWRLETIQGNPAQPFIMLCFPVNCLCRRASMFSDTWNLPAEPWDFYYRTSL